MKSLSDVIELYKNFFPIGSSWGAIFNHNLKEIENKNLFKELKEKNTIGVEMEVLPIFCVNKKLDDGALITLVDNVTNMCKSFYLGTNKISLTANLQILNTKNIYENEKLFIIAKIDGETKDYISVSCKFYNSNYEVCCRGQQIMGLLKNNENIQKLKDAYYSNTQSKI